MTMEKGEGRLKKIKKNRNAGFSKQRSFSHLKEMY